MRDIEPELRQNARVHELCTAIAACDGDVELTFALIRDLFSAAEILRGANRWAAAELLDDGHSIRNVADELGMSTRTVNRMRKWVNENTGGVQFALARRRA